MCIVAPAQGFLFFLFALIVKLSSTTFNFNYGVVPQIHWSFAAFKLCPVLPCEPKGRMNHARINCRAVKLWLETSARNCIYIVQKKLIASFNDRLLNSRLRVRIAGRKFHIISQCSNLEAWIVLRIAKVNQSWKLYHFITKASYGIPSTATTSVTTRIAVFNFSKFISYLSVSIIRFRCETF